MLASAVGTKKYPLPLHTESDQVLEYLEPVLVGAQHLSEALRSVDGDVPDSVMGGVLHVSVGVLLSNIVRPLMVFTKGFELCPPGGEILTGIIVRPSQDRVGVGSVGCWHFYREEDAGSLV